VPSASLFQEGEVGDATQAAGKTVLLLYNLLLKANAKLEVTDKVGDAIATSIEKAKTGASVRKCNVRWVGVKKSPSRHHQVEYLIC
jgi:hypothetical protein